MEAHVRATSGWKKSPRDERDKLRMAPVKALPDQVDLSGYVISIGDQDGLDECTGFGIMYSLAAEGLIDGALSEPFSPDWGYAGARLLEGTLKEDSGAYSRDVYKWVFAEGCLLERFHPFDTKLDTTDPRTWPNAERAKDWRIKEYTRCVDGYLGICAALADHHIVSLGSPWYEAWMNTGSDGKMSEHPGACVGGHQTYLVGYDLIARHFILVNSWGRSWGKGGYGFLPFSALDLFKTDDGYDAYYAVCEWDSVVPPPDPDPQPTPSHKIPLWLPIVLIGAALIALAFLVL